MVIEILPIFKQLKLTNKKSSKQLILSFAIVILSITSQIVAQNAAFNINTSGACTPLSISLTDISTGASTWKWDLGNSNSTIDRNPKLYYILPGIYTVSLTINGGGSANLESTKTINVYPAPNPNIPKLVKGCEPFSGILSADATPVTTQPFTIGSSTIGGITGGIATSYSWNFAGALPTVIQSNPDLKLTNIPAGSYDVLLTVTDEHGCSNSVYKQNAIYISPKPKADFTITKENICSVGKVVFKGTSTISSGNIASYAWDLGNDGTIESTQKDFLYTYTSPGTYNIALTVTSDEGYASEKVVKQVIFNNDNSVDFSFVGGCINQVVSFTDKSSKNVSKWFWDFDNNGTVDNTTQNPNYTYSNQGIKTAKLKVIFNDGCEKDTSKYILINEVKSNFSFNTNSSCAPAFSIAFNSTSTVSNGTTLSTYAWDFNNDNVTDDITPNPIHNFNASGTFPVRLIVSSLEGCSDTTIYNVVIPEVNIDFTNTLSEGCAPLSPSFSPINSNPSDPIISYSWNFGDEKSGANNTSTESNPTHIYNSEGEYDVKLTAVTTKGCIIEKSKLKTVKVGNSQNLISLNYTQLDSCLKTPLNFEATFKNTVDKLIWDFKDGSLPVEQLVTDGTAKMTYTYKKPGTYSVDVEAWCNGCKSSIKDTINGIIINEPMAQFTPSSISECSVPATINFTNTSISKPDNTNYQWNFGDDSISTAFEPTHLYKLPGIFNVTLTATNTLTGCTDIYNSTIFIKTSNPQFTAKDSIICAGSTVEFINQVVSHSSPNFLVASYLWDFGDGATSSEANPTHKYNIPGLYDVKLIVTETHGCVDTINKPNFIDVRGPIVNFKKDKSQVCKGDPVTFTDSTTIATNDTTANPLLNQYLWDFGDGQSSNDKDPTHIYLGSGKYKVSLQVTDNNGCIGTKSTLDSIIIVPIVAGFSTTRDSYCVDSTANILFTNTATGKFLKYDWDLDGDGTFEIIKGDASQKRIFPIKGDYNIKQRVRDSLGCEDTFSKMIRIVDGNAGINLVYKGVGCAPVSTIFEALDSVPDVATYLWKFGDGVTSDLRKPSHDFLRPGHYVVSLTEILIGGCTKTSTMPIDIAGAVGTFNYKNSSGCAPHEVTFRADKLVGVTDLIWDFGDGSTQTEKILAGDTAKTITYTYKTSGSRLPVLILRDSTCGAFSYYDAKKRINISENPIAAFDAATVNGVTCEKFSLQFTDQSTKVDTRYSISTWNWNFGDTTAHSQIQNPTHIYKNHGKYTVILTVTNGVIDSGCVASISHDITVNPLPVATSPTQIQSIYTGLASKDIALSSLLEGTTYVWTRTNPDGITSTQPMSGNVSTDGKISGAVFDNSSSSPITVTYTIIPIGPSVTYCNGEPLIATVTVNPNPLVSIIKSASKPIMNNNGTFSYNYTLKIINNSKIAIDSVQVYDNLDDVFKASGFAYKVTSIVASGNLIANGLYNGSSVTATLIEGKTLDANQQDSIVITLEVDTHKQNTESTVLNQALLSCYFVSNELSIQSDADPLTTTFEPTQNNIPAVDVYIPDAFSPNQDAINQYYVITHTDLVKIEIEVFNRWGSSVYKSTDYQNNWDGKGTGNFLGQNLPSGTYYCIYKVINISTAEIMNNGIKYITLRR